MHRANRTWRQVPSLGSAGRILALIALAGASPGAYPGMSWAQGTPPAPPPAQQGTTVEGLTKSAEDLARSAGDVAKSVGGAIGNLWNDAVGKVAPGAPTDYLPAQISDEDKQFFAILETIGLRLKDVTVSKGVLPSASYRFVANREPTDTDIATAEDLLRAYRDAQTGMMSRARQRIARSTLDTVSTAGYALTSMEVTLSPWPDASYQITTKDAAAPKP